MAAALSGADGKVAGPHQLRVLRYAPCRKRVAIACEAIMFEHIGRRPGQVADATVPELQQILHHGASRVAIGRLHMGQPRAGNALAQAYRGHLLGGFGRGRRQQAAIEQQHAIDAAALTINPAWSRSRAGSLAVSAITRL